ncbi:hypothetical protein [Paenibacillus glucanolyticus]|uniref:hypothetical protein n=1 Tax=Paenibacillus glucanolyticus TaxID=59843 RepID=UPI0034CFB535
MLEKEKTPRLTVYLPDPSKSELAQMAKNTGLSQTQLVVMATHSLLANYRAKGDAIFSGLLSIGSIENK